MEEATEVKEEVRKGRTEWKSEKVREDIVKVEFQK